MNEPETLPLILGLVGWCVLMTAIAWVADRRTKRNRWINPPRPDSRSSIEQFKRMHTP